MTIQLRWLNQADGSDARTLQFRQFIPGYFAEDHWTSWESVPEVWLKNNATDSAITVQTPSTKGALP